MGTAHISLGSIVYGLGERAPQRSGPATSNCALRWLPLSLAEALDRHGAQGMGAALVVKLPGHLVELHRLRIELWRLHELQEEIGHALAQARERLFWPSTV